MNICVKQWWWRNMLWMYRVNFGWFVCFQVFELINQISVWSIFVFFSSSFFSPCKQSIRISVFALCLSSRVSIALCKLCAKYLFIIEYISRSTNTHTHTKPGTERNSELVCRMNTSTVIHLDFCCSISQKNWNKQWTAEIKAVSQLMGSQRHFFL